MFIIVNMNVIKIWWVTWGCIIKDIKKLIRSRSLSVRLLIITKKSNDKYYKKGA